MSALAEHLGDYLALRRGLGFQLERHGRMLPSFVAYLEAAGATTVTVELAVAWARLPVGIKPITVDFRLSTVRGFSAYLHAIHPDHEVVPRGLLVVPRHRPAPFIYTADQIAALVGATRRLRPPLRAVTFKTLIGLLAATGMRQGEARALTRDDVDLKDGVITVRHAKFDRVRLVPLHPSVRAALGAYAARRDRLCPTPEVDRFFVSVTGRVLQRAEIDRVFRRITGWTGLLTETAHPRVHDLRHSFAVHTLIDAHRGGEDVSALLPVLSTYLGHVEPANTYWYLSAVPELMSLAAARLEDHQAGRP